MAGATLTDGLFRERAVFEVVEGLLHLIHCVHHERAILEYRLAQRAGRDKQEAGGITSSGLRNDAIPIGEDGESAGSCLLRPCVEGRRSPIDVSKSGLARRGRQCGRGTGGRVTSRTVGATAMPTNGPVTPAKAPAITVPRPRSGRLRRVSGAYSRPGIAVGSSSWPRAD